MPGKIAQVYWNLKPSHTQILCQVMINKESVQLLSLFSCRASLQRHLSKTCKHLIILIGDMLDYFVAHCCAMFNFCLIIHSECEGNVTYHKNFSAIVCLKTGLFFLPDVNVNYFHLESPRNEGDIINYRGLGCKNLGNFPPHFY